MTVKDHLERGDVIVSLPFCPHCNGRGWFLINPFATRGGNGFGGLHNMRQCETCHNAHEYFQANGRLPPELEALNPNKEQPDKH